MPGKPLPLDMVNEDGKGRHEVSSDVRQLPMRAYGTTLTLCEYTFNAPQSFALVSKRIITARPSYRRQGQRQGRQSAAQYHPQGDSRNHRRRQEPIPACWECISLSDQLRRRLLRRSLGNTPTSRNYPATHQRDTCNSRSRYALAASCPTISRSRQAMNYTHR
jgi:hypothetical protein